MSRVSSSTEPRRGLSDKTFGVLLTLPALALLAVIVCYPLVSALVTSLFNQSLVLPGRSFAGLSNFADVLGDDAWPVLRHTAVFTVFATVLPFLIGFAAALALNVGLRGQAVLRSVFLLPWVLPGVVVSFIWLWI